MSILDIFKVTKIKKENEDLHALFNKINATEAIEVQNNINKLTNENNLLIKNIELKNNELNNLCNTITQKKNDLLVLDEELLLESFALYKPKFIFFN